MMASLKLYVCADYLTGMKAKRTGDGLYYACLLASHETYAYLCE